MPISDYIYSPVEKKDYHIAETEAENAKKAHISVTPGMGGGAAPIKLGAPSGMPGYVPKAEQVAPAMPVIPVNENSTPAVLRDSGGSVVIYDDGGKAESTTRWYDPIVKPVVKLYDQARALVSPLTSEQESMKEKERNIEQYQRLAPPAIAPKSPDMVVPQPLKKESSLVDLNRDGVPDHQMALLSHGERVLSPIQNKVIETEHPELRTLDAAKPIQTVTMPVPSGAPPAYDRGGKIAIYDDGGAPVDFGGRVIDISKLPEDQQAIIRAGGQPSEEPDINAFKEGALGTEGDVAPIPERFKGQETPPNTVEQTAKPGLSLASTTTPPKGKLGEAMPKEVQAAPLPLPSTDMGKVQKPSGVAPGTFGTPSAAVAAGERPDTDVEKMFKKGDFISAGSALLAKNTAGSTTAQPSTVTKPDPVKVLKQGKAAYNEAISHFDSEYEKALKDHDLALAGQIKTAKADFKKSHPLGDPTSLMPGNLGKTLHALSEIGQYGALAIPGYGTMAAALETQAPGTQFGMAREREEGLAESEAASKENLEQAQAKLATATAQYKGVPQIVKGQTATDELTGISAEKYEMPGTNETFYTPTGTDFNPNTPADRFATPDEAFSAAQKRRAQGQVAAAPASAAAAPTAEAGSPAAAAATGGTPVQQPDRRFQHTGKAGPENKPASLARVKEANDLVGGLNFLKPEERKAYSFPEGYTPTEKEVDDRIKSVNDLAAAHNKGDQEEFNNATRRLTLELAQEREQQKVATTQQTNSDTANSVYNSLIAQKQYQEAMWQWYNSGNYEKDVAFVGEVINDAKHQTGNFSSWGVDTGVGAMVGGLPGATVGAIAGAIGHVIGPTADVALAALKKRGISNEGYNAMQAYFNALPGRLLFETSVAGMKATAMRMREVMNQIMNAVPPPNTPQRAFDNAFTQYYGKMKYQTEDKINREKQGKLLPPDYIPPTRTQLGIPPAIHPPNAIGHMPFKDKQGKQHEYWVDKDRKPISVYDEL